MLHGLSYIILTLLSYIICTHSYPSITKINIAWNITIHTPYYIAEAQGYL